ncbi:hypothetical protein Rsub_04102 [Raphidocelis subcapitata]|uniref:RWD domain-containing protein 3 n=1 Tax=Raphidocelis subcapitata TaxID=307507 RepID=A0A2V0NXG3_9CHLO|nr:hypothetical protein Rsub_04102 [Raphidocelis subcapitata]|eukprot:GBF91362.1 hypothetical protein Rsub_04102 [Raphidocelis subcapitata]
MAAAAAAAAPDDPRVGEVVALQAIYGDRFECDEPFAAAALQSGGDGQLPPETAAALAASSCSGTIQISADGGAAWTTLHFCLPPGYPARAARCHAAASPQLPRAEADALTAQLQRRADEAAAAAAAVRADHRGGGGGECLYDLAEAVRDALAGLLLTGPAAASDAAAGQNCAAAAEGLGGGGSGGEEDVARRRVLLRLDHIRNRPLYTKTIRRWVKELGLSGRLLFCRGLILIALEGGGGAVSTYLRRARTELVDVDSGGRKCRERMLSVLEDSQASCAAPSPRSCGSAGAGAGSAWCGTAATGDAAQAPCFLDAPGQGPPFFADFRELDLEGFEDAAALLGCSTAQVLEWAGLARGR